MNRYCSERTLQDTPYLFVYGTLRPSLDNPLARTLRLNADIVAHATVSGRLYRIGSYPGLILSAETGDRVHGDVCRLHNPADLLPILDAYEGCGVADPAPHEFERACVPVELDDGTSVIANVYVYCSDLKGYEQIAGGDFLAELPLTDPLPAKPASD